MIVTQVESLDDLPVLFTAMQPQWFYDGETFRPLNVAASNEIARRWFR